MTGGFTWAAQPRQDKFLREFDGVFESFYGGAAGGGKTDSLLIFQAQRRSAFPRSAGLFLRRRYTDLNKPGAALDRFRELFVATGLASYDANAHLATWYNGSVTSFGYMESDQDRYQYHGSQFDDVCWDELTQFSEIQYRYMFSRARVRNPDLARLGLKPRHRSAGNPGGIGHAWVKERFVERCREQIFVDTDIAIPLPDGTTMHPDRIFIPAKLSDNKALEATDPMYRLGLMLLPEQERRALLDGDWDLFEGQFFREWRRDIHVVDPVRVPDNWRKWIGFDWGYAAPWVALFCAQDPDTRQVVVYRELSGKRMNDIDIARAIIEASRDERIDVMYCDPSIWAQKNDTSTAKIMATTSGWRIRMEPANNDRLEGWRRVHQYLGWEPDGPSGVSVSPILSIFASCLDCLRTIPSLVHDLVRVEDLDSDGEDHWADALRYALVSRPIHALGGLKAGTLVLLPR